MARDATERQSTALPRALDPHTVTYYSQALLQHFLDASDETFPPCQDQLRKIFDKHLVDLDGKTLNSLNNQQVVRRATQESINNIPLLRDFKAANSVEKVGTLELILGKYAIHCKRMLGLNKATSKKEASRTASEPEPETAPEQAQGRRSTTSKAGRVSRQSTNTGQGEGGHKRTRSAGRLNSEKEDGTTKVKSKRSKAGEHHAPPASPLGSSTVTLEENLTSDSSAQVEPLDPALFSSEGRSSSVLSPEKIPAFTGLSSTTTHISAIELSARQPSALPASAVQHPSTREPSAKQLSAVQPPPATHLSPKEPSTQPTSTERPSTKQPSSANQLSLESKKPTSNSTLGERGVPVVSKARELLRLRRLQSESSKEDRKARSDPIATHIPLLPPLPNASTSATSTTVLVNHHEITAKSGTTKCSSADSDSPKGQVGGSTTITDIGVLTPSPTTTPILASNPATNSAPIPFPSRSTLSKLEDSSGATQRPDLALVSRSGSESGFGSTSAPGFASAPASARQPVPVLGAGSKNKKITVTSAKDLRKLQRQRAKDAEGL